MKYSDMVKATKGATLWHTYSENDDTARYWTFGHIDLSNEIVQWSLIRFLQQEGDVTDWGQGKRIIFSDRTTGTHAYMGHIDDDEEEFRLCNENGETRYDGFVSELPPLQVTLVEVDFDDE